MRQYFCCCEYYYISPGGYQYVPVPEGGTERMESGSSKWCPGGRTRGKWTHTKTQEVPSEIRECFLLCDKVVE